MMRADHPFTLNGWSVSFLELAFYFGCPGVNAFGGFVTFVHFVEGKSYECTVYHGDGRGEGIPVRADFVAQEGTPYPSGPRRVLRCRRRMCRSRSRVTTTE